MRVRLDVVQGRGAPQRLEVEATSLDEARQQVEREGYTVLALRPTGLDWRHLLIAPRAGRLSFDVDVFVEQLRDLIGAGLSVIEALATLQRGAATHDHRTLDTLVARLRGGQRLSEAFAAQPQFPSLLVALVRAAELTSELPQALSRFLEHQQRVTELRHRITSVAIYPLLLIGVGIAVLLFLLFFVMPRFARVFEGMNSELPWSARAMVWWGQWLASQGAWVVGAGGALLICSPSRDCRPQPGPVAFSG